VGKTSFSGPAYGAKSLLWSMAADKAAGSSVAVVMAGINVPSGEDWYACHLMAFRGSTQSTGAVVALVDDSTSLGTIALTSSLANVSGSFTFTPDPGEYEGVRIASGSSVTLTVTDASTLAGANWQAWVYGYIRFISSTRAE
jgi:hypothetical protein